MSRKNLFNKLKVQVSAVSKNDFNKKVKIKESSSTTKTQIATANVKEKNLNNK